MADGNHAWGAGRAETSVGTPQAPGELRITRSRRESPKGDADSVGAVDTKLDAFVAAFDEISADRKR